MILPTASPRREPAGLSSWAATTSSSPRLSQKAKPALGVVRESASKQHEEEPACPPDLLGTGRLGGTNGTEEARYICK